MVSNFNLLKTKFVLFAILILNFCYGSAFGQQGKVDAFFNSFDDGLKGEGFDGNVRVVIENTDGTVHVAGDFLNFNGEAATRILMLTSSGERASGFAAGTGFNGSVVSGFATTNGKLIYGGGFTNYNGNERNYLVRLNLNGTLDTSFNSGNVGPNATVQAMSQFSDGSVLVAGDAITSYNGLPVNNVFKITADGQLDTAFNANISSGTTGAISKVLVQSDGKLLICGSFTTFNGAATRGLVRLNASGILDTSFGTALGSSADNNILAMDVQPDGKIILGGAFTSFNSNSVGRILRLNPDGTRDNSFNTTVTSGFTNGIVQTLLYTEEGIYVAGSFTGNYNGATLSPTLNRFILLNKNTGVIDSDFDRVSGLPSSTFYTIVLATDQQVFLGGSFTTYDSTPRGRLVKVDKEGVLDTGFLSSGGVGANNSVLKLLPLPDNKTMIFGSFTSFNGVGRNRITRLNTDGSLDTSFNVGGTGASNTLRAAIRLADGSMVFGGNFTTYNGTTRTRIAKITTDGSLVTSFNPVISNGTIYSIAEDANGRLLVGGTFTTVAGVTRNRLVRLNADGSVDASFVVDVNNTVESIIIEPTTNKIIIGGNFTNYNGTIVTRLVRLDASGNLDPTFNNNSGPNGSVYALAFQSGGRLLIGGTFTTFGGVSKQRFLRLTADGTIDSTFKSGVAFSNGNVRSIIVQPDDRFVIGGTFSGSFTDDDLIPYQVRRILRLKSNGIYDPTFNTLLNGSCFAAAIDTEGSLVIGGSFSSINGTAKHRVGKLLLCTNQSTRNLGSWSRGTPDKKFEVTIQEDYSLTENTHWCNCSVVNGKTLTVNTAKTLTLAFDVLGNVTTHSGIVNFLNTASLLQKDASSLNTGLVEYHRISKPMKNFDFTYWSSPVANQNIVALSPNTLSDKYFKYHPLNGWLLHTGTMIPGEGYIIRVPKPVTIYANGESWNTPTYEQPVAFKGVPNNGNYTFAVGANQYNLVGNPYPSAIDATKFIEDNIGIIHGPLYFWTHNTPISNNNYTANDYATFNFTGATATAMGNYVDMNNNGILDVGEEMEPNRPTGYIAAGQSFFVGSKDAGSFQFNNDMRISGQNDNFFKQKSAKKTSSDEKNRLWLNLTNSEGAFKQLLVGYIEGATNDWDNLYDGPTFDGHPFVDFYSINQGKNLTIQGRALPFSDKDEVPLGYRSTIEGTFSISIDTREGELGQQEIWLEDKTTKVLHNLTQSTYSFTGIKGVENDRFVLKYYINQLSTDDNVLEDKKLIVSVKNKVITINSSGGAITKVEIFDLLGRKLYDTSIINEQKWSISTIKSSKQVVMVRTTLTNGAVLSKKIIF